MASVVHQRESALSMLMPLPLQSPSLLPPIPRSRLSQSTSPGLPVSQTAFESIRRGFWFVISSFIHSFNVLFHLKAGLHGRSGRQAAQPGAPLEAGVQKHRGSCCESAVSP